MGGCQNYGPFLGTLKNRCRSIIGTSTGPNPTTLNPKSQFLPVAQRTYLFKELYTETITRNPKKVGLSGYR